MFSLIRELLSWDRNRLSNIAGDMREKCLERYDWDETAQIWTDIILKVPNSTMWNSPPRMYTSHPIVKLTKPMEQANFLIQNVLCKPELMYKALWKRLLKDLTYVKRLENTSSEFYYSEHHEKDQMKTFHFTFEDAYKEMVNLRNYYNKWEENRMNYERNN
jgi:hypothetical protein